MKWSWRVTSQINALQQNVQVVLFNILTNRLANSLECGSEGLVCHHTIKNYNKNSTL